MKKNKHPKMSTTTIVLTNGATFNKNWIFYKKVLYLDIDSLNHKLWNVKNKRFKVKEILKF